MTATCTIPDAKIRDYLLNPEHEIGRWKAAFFMSQGFTRDKFIELSHALEAHFAANAHIELDKDEWGRRFECKGPIKTPSGKTPTIISAWMQGDNDPVPRFISAHPD